VTAREMAELHGAVMARLPKGPHIFRTWTGRHVTLTPENRGSVWDWCGGPGACEACDEKRGVLLEEVLMWRELTGWMAGLAFGRHGSAHCSAATYEELKAGCVASAAHRFDQAFLAHPLNGFSVHAAEGAPDGVLVRCDCGKK
jgi:hypothetical protein